MVVRQCINKYKGMNFNQLENNMLNLEIELNMAIKNKVLITPELYEPVIAELNNDLNKARADFAQFLAVRSKANYYQLGEKSTKYFLNQLNEKRKKMLIMSIVGSDGTLK